MDVSPDVACLFEESILKQCRWIMLIWNGYLFEFNLREWFFLDYATTITTLVKPSKHHVQLGFREINLFNDFHNNLSIREDGSACLKHSSWQFRSQGSGSSYQSAPQSGRAIFIKYSYTLFTAEPWEVLTQETLPLAQQYNPGFQVPATVVIRLSRNFHDDAIKWIEIYFWR